MWKNNYKFKSHFEANSTSIFGSKGELSLGTYATSQEAARAVDRGEIHFYGNNARLNFKSFDYQNDDSFLSTFGKVDSTRFVAELRKVGRQSKL